MTTTSVFQGIQEGSKLSSRVLKPPGGGSSISFFSDDDDKPSRSSPQPSSPSSANGGQEPTPISTETEVKGDTSPVAPPQSHKEESNGMVLEKKVSDQQDTSSSVNESLPESIVVVNEKSNGVTKCDSEIENSKSTTSNGVHLNGTSVNGKVDITDVVNGNEVKEVVGNGVPKSPDVPKMVVYQTASVASPLFAISPSASSPSMKPNEDTQDRVIGHSNGNSTPQQSVQSRKIKDHMRSSIFMSDEEFFTPTRSSRVNATVKDTTTENVPTAGQRQRIPPGGFSSKLW